MKYEELFAKLPRPFIIAEMSGNHNQSIDRALKIVEEAAKSGAHAIKLQTYTADTMTLPVSNPDFMINSKGSLWSGRNLYDLYKDAHTPWEWHKPIFEYCRELGIIGFSTPFDSSAVDFLEELNVPFYKVASFELTDLRLITKIAQTKKPIIMSVGMATVAEIDEAVRTARSNGCPRLVLLKCTSSYPASPIDSNINTIPHLKDLFNVEVGLSDHTLGFGVAVASVALGATVIEKHFTLCRADGGVDSAFSLEPHELKLLTEEAAKVYQALGNISYGPSAKEIESLQFRRSIYICKDLKKGDILTEQNVRIIRPGYGLPPKEIKLVIGRKITQDASIGTALKYEMLGEKATS